MDLAMVADIKYGVLAELEDTIRAKEAARPEQPMLPDAVNPDAIAKVRPCKRRAAPAQPCPALPSPDLPCPGPRAEPSPVGQARGYVRL